MLHVILLILKIIGLLLLAILGLLLLIILIVLLVPIRYKVNAEHGETIRVEGRANWLLHLVRARVSHIEGIFHIRVMVLWFTLFDNLEPKQPKEKKPGKRAARKKADKLSGKKSELSAKQAKDTGDQNKSMGAAAGPDNTAKREATESKEGRPAVTESKITEPKITESMAAEPAAAKRETAEPVTESKPAEKPTEAALQTTPGEPEAATKTEALIKPIEQAVISKKAVQAEKHDKETRVGEADSSGQSRKKKNIFIKINEKIKDIKERMKGIIEKIKGVKERISTFFRELKNKIVKLYDTVVNIRNKIGLISAFIKDKLNREGFRITYSSLKKLLKHILPTRLKSRIIFGTGDPCSTGQALGAMGILYSFYGDKVQIIPDFENKVFEGKHYARGRIRLATLLIIVIKLLLDKRFQQLKRNFQILKEAL
jgi:hypothetical protein